MAFSPPFCSPSSNPSPLPPPPTHTWRAPDLVSLALVCRSLTGLMLLTPDCSDFPFEAKSQLRPKKMKMRLHLHSKAIPQVCGGDFTRGAVCKPSSSGPCLHGSPVLGDSAEAGPPSGSTHAPEFPLHAKSSRCPDHSAVVLGCKREGLR